MPLGRSEAWWSGGNPYILNWVTRITEEKVWQLNNKGLKINSCYSMLSPLKSNDGGEAVIPSLSAFRRLTRGKTQMPLVEQCLQDWSRDEEGGGIRNLPDPPYKVSAKSQSHRMVWVGGDFITHPPSTRPDRSKPHPTWLWTFPGIGNLCQGLTTHTTRDKQELLLQQGLFKSRSAGLKSE